MLCRCYFSNYYDTDTYLCKCVNKNKNVKNMYVTLYLLFLCFGWLLNVFCHVLFFRMYFIEDRIHVKVKTLSPFNNAGECACNVFIRCSMFLVYLYVLQIRAIYRKMIWKI